MRRHACRPGGTGGGAPASSAGGLARPPAAPGARRDRQLAIRPSIEDVGRLCIVVAPSSTSYPIMSGALRVFSIGTAAGDGAASNRAARIRGLRMLAVHGIASYACSCDESGAFLHGIASYVCLRTRFASRDRASRFSCIINYHAYLEGNQMVSSVPYSQPNTGMRNSRFRAEKGPFCRTGIRNSRSRAPPACVTRDPVRS